MMPVPHNQDKHFYRPKSQQQNTTQLHTQKPRES